MGRREAVIIEYNVNGTPWSITLYSVGMVPLSLYKGKKMGFTSMIPTAFNS